MAPAKNFGKDSGLQARMLLTMFLLGLLYVILIGVLFAAGVGAVAILVIAAVLFAIQFFTSDKIALASMGAHQVSPAEAPELHAIIERLCLTANLPKPRVAVARTPMPNAFAVGRSPKTATVCVTTGLLQLFDGHPAELEAVLGHELTHVANRDVMVMTLASFFASIASFIVQIGFWTGLGFDDNDDNGPSFMVVMLVAGMVYLVSFVLLQALSRYREFAADRGSAIITGRPSALISALMRIDGGMNQIPQRDMRQAAGGLAAFYIFPPKVKQGLSTLFATHPTLDQRIAALTRLETQLQGAR
ncbi:MAG TPA: zinc metalloprotease HtpX [Solirubrobacteraceae bacterium]|jgi:heat shock protein HtpX|nr:zinc metalloprotease HtpX [Solirubrobacteraceae bacterium]